MAEEEAFRARTAVAASNRQPRGKRQRDEAMGQVDETVVPQHHTTVEASQPRVQSEI